MANWKVTHAEKNQREGDTYHNNWKRRTVWNKSTHAKKMKWKMIPTMKSSLKATHAIKGNSKEVSQPGERLPEHKEG